MTDTPDTPFVISDTPAPPAAQDSPAPPEYVMALGEGFTREQYHEAGWTDAQLVAVGKMSIVSDHVDLSAPVGMPDTTWVVLDDNDDIPPTGLFVGHNGTGYLIQTGVPVPVPNKVLGVLDDAVMDAPVLDPKTRQVIGYRPRPRYTYRKVPAPTSA